MNAADFARADSLVARLDKDSEPIVELRNLSRRFSTPLDLVAKVVNRLGAGIDEEVVHAVDRVSMHILRGEVMGLVGESGCGKSTLGRMVAGTMRPSAGQILHHGCDVTKLRGRPAREHALAVQMIFQDPYNSLNPRMRVRSIIGEAPLVHGLTSRHGVDAYVSNIMEKVKLNPEFKRRYPHQFSGGQRQRIGIARALAVNPELIVCDEAVSALDVSVQAQILNLFMELRERLNLTYLFISHDLGVVQHISDRTAIMYVGRIVEEAATEELFARPNHPYTQGLIAEIPRIEARKRRFQGVKGEIPSPLAPPRGCHFHPRCPHAMPICQEIQPPLKEVAPGHVSACHLNG